MLRLVDLELLVVAGVHPRLALPDERARAREIRELLLLGVVVPLGKLELLEER